MANDSAAYRIDGQTLLDHVVPAKEFLSLRLMRRQTLRIIDIEGQQVMNLVFLAADDPEEALSSVWTKVINKTWKITKGHTLYSFRGNQMATITEDMVGLNHAGGTFCSEQANRLLYGVPFTRNCNDNIAHAFAKFGIDRRRIPETSHFSAFMNVSYDPDGTHEIRPPISKAGDYIDFETQMDLLVGLSCCPQERNPCNNYKAKPMKVIVYEKR